MSILIKGMGMPKKCQSCLLYKPYAGNGFCLMAGKRLIYNETPSNPKGAGRFCPLVELPERHGRLIDADALIAKYGDWYTEEGTDTGFIGTLEMLIKDAPTVVEAEGAEVKK